MIEELIRKKYIRVTSVVILVFSLIAGISSLFVINHLEKSDTEKIVTHITGEEALKINNKLDLVQHAVKMLDTYVKEIANNREYEIFSDEFIERVRAMSISVANNTDGAVAVYFRYNPELTGDGTTGFFWSRKDYSKPFEPEEVTNILDYNANDIQHVGWYYVPKQTGKSLWMSPYYNQNLDVFMISYIVPLYLNNGDFLGVIGMDIDFSVILSVAKDASLYNSGKVGLFSKSEHLAYFLDDTGAAVSEKPSNHLNNRFTSESDSSEVFETKDDNGKASIVSYSKLKNDMVLFVDIPKNEINAQRNIIITVIVVGNVVALIIAIILVRILTSSAYKRVKANNPTDEVALKDETE